MFKTEIKQHVNYIFTFYMGQQLDRGTEIRRQQALGHGNLQDNEHRVHME